MGDCENKNTGTLVTGGGDETRADSGSIAEHAQAGGGATHAPSSAGAASAVGSQEAASANGAASVTGTAQATGAASVNAASPASGWRGAARGHFTGSVAGGLAAFWNSPLARCGFIGLITILLLIPLGMVTGLVYDRSELYYNATQSIAGSWGREQTISGPLLIVPYQTWTERIERVKVEVALDKDKEKYREKYEDVVKRDYHTRYKVILPSELHFDTEINPEVRYRGIYKQALYLAPVDISGSFSLPKEEEFAPNLSKVYWDQAWVSFGITGLTSIAETSRLNWNGDDVPGNKPGANAGNLLGNGFHCPLALSGKDQGEQRDFAMRLKVRGSGGIYFTPVGESTVITMKGDWPAPSFQGALLPTERTIVDQGENKGFSAKWVISNLTRTYPQIGDVTDSEFMRHNSSAITDFVAGMDLLEPVSLYRMVGRSVEYGILFIAVSFVALFAFEFLCGQRMHLLQYGMVGLSMSIFYLILLSLSEHAGFVAAFAGASAVTVLMNSLYLAAAMRSWKKGLVMGGLLSALYAVLYSLLNMEDFALLVGTGLVLAMMAVLMFVTRNLPQGGAAKASKGRA